MAHLEKIPRDFIEEIQSRIREIRMKNSGLHEGGITVDSFHPPARAAGKRPWRREGVGDPDKFREN